MSDEIRPWDRQPGEPRKVFHAFTHYRDMEPHERTMGKAYTAHRARCAPLPGDPPEIPAGEAHWRPTKTWKTWKRLWNWDGRADAHDAHVAEEDRLKRIREIREMNERHAAIATALQGKGIQRLNGIDPNTLSMGQLVLLFREATAIERRARGEPTEIVKHEGDQPPRDLSNLSEEELDQLERLLAKTERPKGQPDATP